MTCGFLPYPSFQRGVGGIVFSSHARCSEAKRTDPNPLITRRSRHRERDYSPRQHFLRGAASFSALPPRPIPVFQFFFLPSPKTCHKPPPTRPRPAGGAGSVLAASIRAMIFYLTPQSLLRGILRFAARRGNAAHKGMMMLYGTLTQSYMRQGVGEMMREGGEGGIAIPSNKACPGGRDSVDTSVESKPQNMPRCQCCDKGCPCCHGSCSNAGTHTLYRMDMADETGTLMCDGCGDDAFASGLFQSKCG